MTKKSDIKIPTIVIIRIIVFLFIGFIFFLVYSRTADFLFKNSLFNIKEIKVDQSISFIDPKLLLGVKGENIFKVNLVRIQEKISSQYPQIAQLRVMKRLPDSIVVLAKKRDIFFQVFTQNRYLFVDTQGVMMFYSQEPSKDYPIVQGVNLQRSKIVLGTVGNNKEINVANKLLKEIKLRPHTKRLKVISIQTSNLSKIEIVVAANIKVIIDEDDLSSKVDMLEFLLQNGKINWNNVKYIDVRFKEPVVNETIPQEGK